MSLSGDFRHQNYGFDVGNHLFLQISGLKSLFVWKKVVPLWQQFPPRLLTMRTTVGLRFLYEDLKDGNIYEQTDM